jgi:murein DD-endopeptidase MepM/ murein hydrolase activator NlpD
MFLPHKHTLNKTAAALLVVLLAFSASFSISNESKAQSVNELKSKIQDRNKKISDLEREIAAYQTEINEIGQEKQTLQSAIRSLDLSGKKIQADISATENKIGASELRIRQLTLEIELQQQKMERSREVMADTFNKLNQAESSSLIENLLSHDNLAEFWSELEYLERFKSGVRNNYNKLSELKKSLEGNKVAMAADVENLESLKAELASKHGSVLANKNEKDELLSLTKNEEAKYQALLAEKEARRAAFLKELKEFESQLDFAINPDSVPSAGKGVLRAPLDNLTITQYFGNTPFAKSGAYNGNGHNGMDFGTPVGTPVKAALGGIVVDLGDTDTVCRNASYGKWILLRHNNGLSTLYAHMSGFNVSKGQQVSTSQVIGYSGNTGYSTGPHLHFTVYATEGVRVMNRPSQACGGVYVMPVADLQAYLNPLDYLSI